MFDEHDEHTAYVGTRHVWGGTKPFGLRRADRRLHTLIVGKTGTGKTTLLRNLILQDIHAGEGVGVIDPHGDLAEEVLAHVPSWRAEDVVYFNPADEEHPIGLNLLAPSFRGRDHLIVSGVVDVFKSIWRDFWGPRLEYVLYATIAALLDCREATLLGVQRMLVDEQYRRWVVRQVKDPVVAAFWTREFAHYDRRFVMEVIAPVQNKVGQLLMAPPIRNIVGQVRSKVNFRFMMDDRRIFIANLAKGRLGSDKVNLLGSLIVTQFQLAAMSRADLPEERRRDFNLFVDEFHNFSTDSFDSVLSEARKYRLGLVLSNQFLGQLRASTREAVWGNVGSMIAFRVGEADATLLERQYGGGFALRHFVELSNHEVCVKLLVAGEDQAPFWGRTLPPLDLPCGRKETLARRSREKYATVREKVEGKINRWFS